MPDVNGVGSLALLNVKISQSRQKSTPYHIEDLVDMDEHGWGEAHMKLTQPIREYSLSRVIF